MNCERVKEFMPDVLTRSVPEEVRAELEAHIEQCAACRNEQQSLTGLWARLSSLPVSKPSAELDRRFHTTLQAYVAELERAEQRAPRASFLEWLRQKWPQQPAWQFAALLVLFGTGLIAGWGLGLTRGRGSASESEDQTLAELQREVLTLKEQMAMALLQQKSASERLRGVEWSSRLEAPDEQVLGALLRALETDPNVNVRLAAVGALEPFAQRELVRKALREELPRQQSPLIQAELIHLLVEVEDKDSIPVLRSMLENQEVDASVKEQAKWAIVQLG